MVRSLRKVSRSLLPGLDPRGSQSRSSTRCGHPSCYVHRDVAAASGAGAWGSRFRCGHPSRCRYVHRDVAVVAAVIEGLGLCYHDPH